MGLMSEAWFNLTPLGTITARFAKRRLSGGTVGANWLVSRQDPPMNREEAIAHASALAAELAQVEDAPISRAVEKPGRIICRSILGGLHRQMRP